jgi:excisionase family DNA binding protein
MGISIRHNSVEEAARYLRMRPEHIYAMMDRGEIEVLRLGGVDYVALDVITEGNGPRRYQPHRPGQTAKPVMPPVSRSRPRRRK